MTCPSKNKTGKQNTNEYACVEDFRSVFTEGRNDLYGLWLHLTGDHDKAEQCFVAGREDCVKATRVFKEWARSWAKRAVIQNAIRGLKPRPSRSNSSSFTVPIHVGELQDVVDAYIELDAVLALEQFERLVFVMSVLERYSQYDCALLLGCTHRQIEDARTRAFAQLTGVHRAVLGSEIRSEMGREQAQWRTVMRVN